MKKQRNKPYRPRSVLVPMMKTIRDEIAQKIRIAVGVFLAAPSRDTFEPVTRWLMTLTIAVDALSPVPINRRNDRASLALILANEVCQAIEDRHDRTTKVGFSGDDARDLRAAVDILDESLSRIPFNVWQAATRSEEGIWRQILADRARAAAQEARELLDRSAKLEDQARAEADRVASLVTA